MQRWVGPVSTQLGWLGQVQPSKKKRKACWALVGPTRLTWAGSISA